MDRTALALALLGMGIKGVGDYFGTKRSMDYADKKFEADERYRRESEKPAALKMVEHIKANPQDEALAMNTLSASGGYMWKPTAGGQVVKTDVPSARGPGGRGKPDDVALMGKVSMHEEWAKGGMKGPEPPRPTPEEMTRAKGIKTMKKTYDASGSIVR